MNNRNLTLSSHYPIVIGTKGEEIKQYIYHQNDVLTYSFSFHAFKGEKVIVNVISPNGRNPIIRSAPYIVPRDNLESLKWSLDFSKIRQDIGKWFIVTQANDEILFADVIELRQTKLPEYSLSSETNTLIFSTKGPGQVSIDPGVYNYQQPTEIVINATPDQGYKTTWLVNDQIFDGDVLTTIVEQNKKVEANFIPIDLPQLKPDTYFTHATVFPLILDIICTLSDKNPGEFISHEEIKGSLIHYYNLIDDEIIPDNPTFDYEANMIAWMGADYTKYLNGKMKEDWVAFDIMQQIVNTLARFPKKKDKKPGQRYMYAKYKGLPPGIPTVEFYQKLGCYRDKPEEI